jgi:predicted O-methyltransferase YrrM
MSYHGFIPLIKQNLHQQVPNDRAPTVLEIGIDRGVTLVPIVAFLARTRQSFTVIGVDIVVQEQVQIVLQNLDLQHTQQVFCIEGNSLEVMPKMIDQGMNFDVVLLDGDHNYHTVSEEMKYIEALTHPGSIVVCDDYDGRWSERDLWYAEREGYESVKMATAKVETEKHGVKPAIDEWLALHAEWNLSKPIQGEPVLLMRKAPTTRTDKAA